MGERNKLIQTNKNLIAEIEKLEKNLSSKSEIMHRLQVQISKSQKDKITLQEKHSLSMKMNKKKIKNMENSLDKLQKEMDAKPKQAMINKADFNKFKKRA